MIPSPPAGPNDTNTAFPDRVEIRFYPGGYRIGTFGGHVFGSLQAGGSDNTGDSDSPAVLSIGAISNAVNAFHEPTYPLSSMWPIFLEAYDGHGGHRFSAHDLRLGQGGSISKELGSFPRAIS